jgi:hypothetical protein
VVPAPAQPFRSIGLSGLARLKPAASGRRHAPGQRLPVSSGRQALSTDIVERALAFWRLRRHNGAMPSVQIKDVPERTHAVLRQRAAAAHQSLQEYLRARLIEEADQPTLQEILDRAGGRSGGSVPIETAVAALHDDRARR